MGSDGQFAVEHVEALVFTVMDVQRRPGFDHGLEDAQGSARGVPRGLHTRIVGHASTGREDIACQEVGHEYMITAELRGRGGDDGFRSRCLHLDRVALSRLSYIT
jgi:hypothetical protein